jgi:flagellum-specific ATP synthase
VADSLRSVLDGHIVLSRELAQRGHYPPIDVLRSVSRLQRDVVSAQDCALAAKTVALLSMLERHRDAVDLGLYQRGSNAALDDALDREQAIGGWLQQGAEPDMRAHGLQQLRAVLEGAAS